MPRIDLEIDGLKELIDKLSPDRAKQAAEAGVRALSDGAILIEEEARRLAPVETGNLRRSITRSQPYLHTGILTIEVGTNAEYAPFVEFGTGRRGASGAVEGNGFFTETARLAMAAIGYVYGAGKKRPNSPGMAARPFLFPAFEKYREKIIEMITAAVSKVIAEEKT